MKTALITGITGQDGSYLAEFLLEKDTSVAIIDKYPTISYNLRHHKDCFGDEKIIHSTAAKALVDCILALEKVQRTKRIFTILHETRASLKNSRTISCN